MMKPSCELSFEYVDERELVSWNCETHICCAADTSVGLGVCFPRNALCLDKGRGGAFFIPVGQCSEDHIPLLGVAEVGMARHTSLSIFHQGGCILRAHSSQVAALEEENRAGH